jgi:hypothetical protein
MARSLAKQIREDKVARNLDKVDAPTNVKVMIANFLNIKNQ